MQNNLDYLYKIQERMETLNIQFNFLKMDFSIIVLRI
jgi:hypothetical protein